MSTDSVIEKHKIVYHTKDQPQFDDDLDFLSAMGELYDIYTAAIALDTHKILITKNSKVLKVGTDFMSVLLDYLSTKPTSIDRITITTLLSQLLDDYNDYLLYTHNNKKKK